MTRPAQAPPGALEAFWLRVSRTFFSLAICEARTLVMSMARMSTLSGSAGRKRLTPTITSSPLSMRACLRRGGLLDAQLRQAVLDGLGHAAERLHLLDQLPRLVGEVLRQRLDIVGAAERIDDIGDAGLVFEDQLGVAGDAGGEIRRQRHRLVEGVGVQRLRAAEHRRHRLEGGAHDVVVGVLLGERDARRLAVRAQHLRAVGLGAEIRHDLRPELARGAQLRRLHEEVHADAEEEGQPAGERVDVEAARLGGADIFHAVGERVGELLRQRRAGLLHVVAADGNRVELRHLGAVYSMMSATMRIEGSGG
jgi:hypothetical protein